LIIDFIFARPAAAQEIAYSPAGYMFCCCFLFISPPGFQPKVGLCFAILFLFLTISVRLIILKSTGPIFAKFLWLEWYRTMVVDDN